jgi:hypothetical protein
MMITQQSAIINNYRMIKKLSPARAQVFVCMIQCTANQKKYDLLCNAVQCRKFGTEYRRSLESAQNHHFMVCFQFKQVKVFYIRLCILDLFITCQNAETKHIF